jgi:hypothetical protein
MTELDTRKLLGFRLVAPNAPGRVSTGTVVGDKPVSCGLKKGTKPGQSVLGLKLGIKVGQKQT